MDLRGFGGTDRLPVDATRGVRDFSDDVHAVLVELGITSAHLVGWSMGGGVVMQYALDQPVASLRSGDTTAESPTSARSVFRSSYVAAGYETDLEDLWVTSMLTTSTEEGNYPGNSAPSENWPGFAAGTDGFLNTMVPKYFNTSGIVDLEEKPPILWVHGTADAIVSDASFFDLNHLGAVGVVPGWPGAEVAPAQEMVSQTRDVLDAYRAAGGQVSELLLESAGHSPHLERPQEVRDAIVALVRG